MKRLLQIAAPAAIVLSSLGAIAADTAPGPIINTLLSKHLGDLPGKELLAITVEYPPGGADPIHRHDAHAFVYVLEGSVVMGLRGGKEVTLTPGQIFYEAPGDIHTVSRNASSTKPTRFLVVFVKEKSVDSVLPVR